MTILLNLAAWAEVIAFLLGGVGGGVGAKRASKLEESGEAASLPRLNPASTPEAAAAAPPPLTAPPLPPLFPTAAWKEAVDDDAIDFKGR